MPTRGPGPHPQCSRCRAAAHPLRQARAEALAREMANRRGAAVRLAYLIEDLCVPGNPPDWTKANIERAVGDLAAAARLDLALGAGGIVLRLSGGEPGGEGDQP